MSEKRNKLIERTPEGILMVSENTARRIAARTPEQRQAFVEQQMHLEVYRHWFDADRLERFLGMPDKERDLLMTAAYLGRLDKPSQVQVNQAAAFVDWFNGDAPLQEVAQRYGVKARRLRRLCDNMPHYVYESTLDVELPETMEEPIGRLAVENVVYISFPRTPSYEDPEAKLASVTPIIGSWQPRI